jgi:hypothetical protein
MEKMSHKYLKVLFVAAVFSVLANGKGEATCDVEKCPTDHAEFKRCCKDSRPLKPGACDKNFPWGRADTLTFSKWMCEFWAEQ